MRGVPSKMIRRRRYVLRGNFQLAWLLSVAILAAVGMLIAAALNLRAMGAALETAVFASHLSLRSSGELWWKALLHINLLVGGLTLLLGCLATIGALLHLEALLGTLAEGIDRLARGDDAFRVKTRGWWWGRDLLRAVNAAAADRQRMRERLRALLAACDAERLPDEMDHEGWLRRVTSLRRQVQQLLEL